MDAEYHSNNATTSLAVSDQPFTRVDDVAAGADGIGLAVAFGALSIFGALGNCLTILAVITNRQLRSQTSSYLIVNLAVADMMVFVIIEPFLSLIVATNSWPFSISLCAAVAVLVIQHVMVSVSSMAAIAVNRFYSVVRHRSYYQTFTRKRTIIMCLVTWVPGLALILPMVLTVPFIALYSSYYGVCIITSSDVIVGRAMSMLTALTILTSIVISSLCYLQIYRTVRESRRRVKPTVPLAGGNINANPDLHTAQVLPPSTEESNKSVRNPNAKPHQVNRAEIAISLNLFIVFAIFCVCWAPLTVLIFAQNIMGEGFQKDSKHIPGWAWQMSYKLVLFNSTMNIFIYAWRNRNFRSAYVKLLKCQRS